jgi:hypothetical protein
MLFETKYARTLRPLLIHALSLVVVGGDGLSPKGSREQVAREAKESARFERERSGRYDCILVVVRSRVLGMELDLPWPTMSREDSCCVQVWAEVDRRD